MWFQEDEKTKETARTVLTVWDVFGDTGGFIEIIAIFTSLFISGYSNFNFNAQIARELYKTDALYLKRKGKGKQKIHATRKEI